jgi:hypothetical protein
MAEALLLRNPVWAGSTALELILLMWIVGAFLFLRYYGLLRAYVNFWNFLDILPFLATLFIWTKPARSYSISPKVVTQPGHQAA